MSSVGTDGLWTELDKHSSGITFLWTFFWDLYKRPHKALTVNYYHSDDTIQYVKDITVSKNAAFSNNGASKLKLIHQRTLLSGDKA